MLPDSTWTSGRPTTAPAQGLHQTVADIALSRPNAVALLFRSRSVTYSALDRTANAWAAQLVDAGVDRGDIVAIVLPRGVDLVTALLAVLKTGAAYALLDRSWPERRIQDVTGVLNARLLIAPPDIAATRPVWSPPSHPVEAPAAFRPATVAGADPCCVFFTSGTTGTPKGVLTSHRATARLVQPRGFARFGSDTVMPLAAAVPWDAFSLELWSVLLNGGTSLIVDEPYLSTEALRTGITEHRVDTVWLTSSLFNMIVDEALDAFDGVRQVMTGGERLSPGHVRRFLRAHPSALLLNGYGPVENVVFATTHRITEADCARPDGIPLGRPVPGTQVYVLDGDRQCAVGEPGEICVSGDGLALGYVGDAARTAEKFTDVPIDGRRTRVYRTGDLGVWGADGLLCFHGRADRQLKLRGHRIEPAEIERQIEQLPTVHQCRVLARRDDTGAALDLVAFCVPTTLGDPLDAILDTLWSTMVDYHRPAAVVTVDALPVTAQGKLDEQALLALPATDPADDDVRHDGPTVHLVAETFADVLGHASVPADVSFFALGGNSLGAGRVCARLAGRLARPVPLSRLYRHPTAAALAAWVDSVAPQPDTGEPAEGTAPLTPMQLVHLTRHLADPTDRTAHCLLFWSIEGDLDPNRLQAAVEEVHLRHEPLSAAYVADPWPAAWLDDVPPPTIERLPTRSAPAAATRALRAALAQDLAPEKGEVWRAALVRAGEATLFGCAVHHLAFDGWSESILAHDLAAAYNGAAGSLPTPPSMAEACRRATPRHILDDHLLDEFRDVPDLRWPAGPTDPAPDEPRRVEIALAPAVVTGLDAVAAGASQTRFVVLLARWAASLAEVTGQHDFAVGVPIAQRDDPLLKHAVGCHMTVVPLRLRGAAVAGDIGATGRIAARSFAAQDMPLHDLLARLDRPRSARPPLFQTLFAMQDNAAPRLELNGLRTTFLRQPYLDLPLELHTELWPDDNGGMRVEIAFRPDVVPAATVQELARRFTDRLRAMSTGAAP